jgi:hypothetical protein
MKSSRGLGQHLRHSDYCSRLKDEIETGARRVVESPPSRVDKPQVRKKTENVDVETLQDETEDDESPNKIVRIMDMDIVQKSRLASAIDRERLAWCKSAIGVRSTFPRGP